MKYIKLTVGLEGYETRFYRTLLVKKNTPLVDLGCIILTSLGGEYEHMFAFKDGNKSYYLLPMFEDAIHETDLLIDDYKLKDLNNRFKFVYDFGEYWCFNCELDKKQIDYEVNYDNGESDTAILIDGKGQGIWEDNINTLYAYLDGELKPNGYKENETKGYHHPWNFDNSKWGDFDKFNLDEAKEYFSSIVDEDMESFKEGYYEKYNDSYEKCPQDDSFDEECDIKASNDISKYAIEFQKNISSLFKYYSCEYTEIKKISKELLVNLDSDLVDDIMIKSFILALYEAGKKNSDFDIEDYKMFISMFTNDALVS